MLAILLACGPKDPPKDTAPGLGSETTAELPFGFASDPVVVGVPAPLSRRIDVVTTAVSTATVTWDDGTSSRTSASDAEGVQHSLQVVGMRPDRAVTAVVTVTDGIETVSRDVAWTTEAVPELWPEVALLAFERERVAPGLTLLMPRAFGSSPVPARVWVLDGEMELIWWLDLPSAVNGVHRTDNGFVTVGDTVVSEFDWLGNEMRTVRPSDYGVGAVAFHHEVLEWDGRIVALAQAPVAVVGFPVSYVDPTVVADVVVANDLLVALDDDGTAEVLWDASAHLDLARIGYGSLETQPDGTVDWAHINAASRLPSDDGWLMSSRHQDAVFAVDDETGTIQWMVAPPVNWNPALSSLLLNPIGDVAFTFQQHAPELDETSTKLLVFDNHGAGASPWTLEVPIADEDNASRAVEYTLDLVNRTIQTSWEFSETSDGPLFVPAMGDVDRLPNGNVLVNFASASFTNHVSNEELGFDQRMIRLIEIDRLTDNVVLDMRISTPLGLQPGGWMNNRVERFEESEWP